MKSPVSEKTALVRIELEPDLVAYSCPDSGGHYLPANSYWRWLSKNPERLPQLPVDASEAPQEEETTGLRLCPESGLAMTRYKVGHGFTFTIDRSPSGGIWFDEGEWNALKERQFHDELHLVFTLPWQNKVRKEASEQKLEELLRERIGEEAFQKASEFRAWLIEQPDPAPILALLRKEIR